MQALLWGYREFRICHSAQMCLDASDQFTEREGLGHVIIGAKTQGKHFVRVAAAGAQN